MEPSREARSSVLIVSNDPAVRDMLANLLTGEGFHVALAGSGTEALKIAANSSLDSALVELFLPDYSGVEFKRRLARVSPKTRVVVLSSFTTIRSSDDVLRFGTSDFILDQREIVELLRAASAIRPAIAKPVAEDARRSSTISLWSMMKSDVPNRRTSSELRIVVKEERTTTRVFGETRARRRLNSTPE